MPFARDIYIDLGTANTLIYVKNQGFVLNEPSAVSYKNSSQNRTLIATGTRSKSMLGKTPADISVVRPLREGVIADFTSTAHMLHGFLKKLRENTFYLQPRMIISLPCRVTEFEKRAVEELGLELGARKIHLLDEPVAAAIGSGLVVTSNRGKMVVDIGGGTTEIAVISIGGIVASDAVRLGGNAIDEAIINHLKNTYNYLIGEPTAERIKTHIGSAVLNNNSAKQKLAVGGINLETGLPSLFEVTARMVYPAINSILEQILNATKATIELCPPEIVADISDSGIVLAGGGALLHGIRERFESEIGVSAQISQHPLHAVALGGARALEDNNLFNQLELQS